MTKSEITVRVGEKGLVVRAGAVATAPTVAVLSPGTSIQVSALQGGVLFGHLVSDDLRSVLAGQWLRVECVECTGYAWTPEDLGVRSVTLDHHDQSQLVVDDVRRIATVTLARYLESIAAGEAEDLAFEGAVQDVADKIMGARKLQRLADTGVELLVGEDAAGVRGQRATLLDFLPLAPLSPWAAAVIRQLAAQMEVLPQAAWSTLGVSLTRAQAVTVVCDLVSQLATTADTMRVDLAQDRKGADDGR